LRNAQGNLEVVRKLRELRECERRCLPDDDLEEIRRFREIPRGISQDGVTRSWKTTKCEKLKEEAGEKRGEWDSKI
jgi:hypothetical protein